MNAITFRFLIPLFAVNWFCHAQSEGMAFVKGGSYLPLYGSKGTVAEVENFEMDVHPVTNADFIAFVTQYPQWRKSAVKKLFAEDNYLYHWKNDLEIKDGEHLKSPVTYVSWFAAKAYCECRGKRLPTVDEWEYVAMADEKLPDARIKASYNQQILAWYETPKTHKNTIGKTPKNYWGVYDLHGLVWEWTLDFNSVLISGESRKDSGKDSNLFCGSAAIGATDLMNYAAFMRYAFRGSVKARYTIKNLGFRCVRSRKNTENKPIKLP
ncbi:formylglycine-generating enzyme family protein [Sinomicrobium kalidii]|uniref:formylglycine-generating enzyme family protein n=1 Tax=Sinomicrobium kalidii TaxID=2900738 RepID=UPI001E622104|nr:formylglycine-generating enzyme family protein [Sinomicrobium kalidii]UGU14644.1 formylglycine-generating enzyme family protein [Sinomicrobium kalidii]